MGKTILISFFIGDYALGIFDFSVKSAISNQNSIAFIDIITKEIDISLNHTFRIDYAIASPMLANIYCIVTRLNFHATVPLNIAGSSNVQCIYAIFCLRCIHIEVLHIQVININSTAAIFDFQCAIIEYELTARIIANCIRLRFTILHFCTFGYRIGMTIKIKHHIQLTITIFFIYCSRAQTFSGCIFIQ